jgi:hypothetical protein
MSSYEEIYPLVKVETRHYSDTGKFHIRMWTKLRVFHLGNWYDWNFFREFRDIDPLKSAEVSQIFHIDVYMTIHFGVVDLNCLDMEGNPVFKLSESQMDEKERLKQLMP